MVVAETGVQNLSCVARIDSARNMIGWSAEKCLPSPCYFSRNRGVGRSGRGCRDSHHDHESRVVMIVDHLWAGILNCTTWLVIAFRPSAFAKFGAENARTGDGRNVVAPELVAYFFRPSQIAIWLKKCGREREGQKRGTFLRRSTNPMHALQFWGSAHQ